MEYRILKPDRNRLISRYISKPIEDEYTSGPYTAIYKAKVINTNDPQNRGRVLVRVFKLDAQEELDDNFTWAYTLQPLGGPQNSGFYIIPPIGSIGFVAYLDGYGGTPIWLGSSNLLPFKVNDNLTIEPLPVEMENDPTTIVLKTQYPTRNENITNNNFYADGTDESKWIKTENLLKLNENEFTLMKFNQGRTSTDNLKIGYTYNNEPYTIDSDVMLEGEIENESDTEDPLNKNYANFFRIQDDELRLFYRTKIKKKNDKFEDAPFSAYSSIWMDDDGIHLTDIWGNSVIMDRDGIHINSNINSEESVFELQDEWGNFVKMSRSGIWVHGANKEDNPQVDDPSGDYEYNEAFENIRFNNETPGLLINTLGTVDFYRVDSSENKLESIYMDEDIIKITAKDERGTIKVEPAKVTLDDSQAQIKLESDISINAGGGSDISNNSMNYKVNANQNVEIQAGANMKIVGGAKVQIQTLVDIGGAIAEALNKAAMIISPPGVQGGPCSIAFPGQVMVKI